MRTLLNVNAEKSHLVAFGHEELVNENRTPATGPAELSATASDRPHILARRAARWERRLAR